MHFNPFTPKSAKTNPVNSFFKILGYKYYHVKVLLKRFHLNGHIIGFHPQTQRLESLQLSPYLTLGVKG